MDASTRRQRSSMRSTMLWMAAALAVLLVAGCGTVTAGRAVSMLDDPYRVGGLPAEDGPSGPRPGAPEPTGVVHNSDGGSLDRQVLLAVNDIADFWTQRYPAAWKGTFTPVTNLVSYDSNDPNSPPVCGVETYHLFNAMYCRRYKVMMWDRGGIVRAAKQFFGDMSINALMAHEYGHAVQQMAGLIDEDTPVLVAEQQADCFAGVYLRWVAEGHSPRFTLSTTDALNHVLAAAIAVRDDPLFAVLNPDMPDDAHGTALDRVSAFQRGFIADASVCGAINMDEIKRRRGDVPVSMQMDPSGNVPSGDIAINNDTLSMLMDQLQHLYAPAHPPTLSLELKNCPDAHVSEPASYCPANNTITVDLPALQRMGKPADESDLVLLQGDNTALSVFISRYMMALQHERGLQLDSAVTALRTACLTGAAQRQMAPSAGSASDKTLVLTAGDIDEAVAGLLTNGLVASDINGATVPAGFTRIFSFRSGLLSDANQCYARFQ